MDVDSLAIPSCPILLPFEILCLSCLSPPSSPRSLGGRRLFLHLTSTDCTFAEGHRYCFKEDNLLQQEGWKYNPTVDSFQTPTVLIPSAVCRIPLQLYIPAYLSRCLRSPLVCLNGAQGGSLKSIPHNWAQNPMDSQLEAAVMQMEERAGTSTRQRHHRPGNHF